VPTVTETTIRCHCCSNLFTNVTRSIFNGVCNNCFDRDYVICTECGRLTRSTLRVQLRASDRARARALHCEEYIGGDAYRYNGEIICSHCASSHCRGDLWLPKPFDVSFATYKRIGSKRKFGVEVETSECLGYEDLGGQIKFGCKTDCTISGREFDSPILYGDEGLTHIEDFLTLAAERNWRVDSLCGCHTHYDMRDESDEQLYHIAYAYAFTSRIWRRCVPRDMQDREYCRPLRLCAADIKSAYDRGWEFMQFASNQERYTHINFNAYEAHSTFEVRVLEGTLDPEVICSWITLHCKFIDAVRDMSFRDLRLMFNYRPRRKFRSFVNLIGDVDLTNWVADRARYVGRNPLRGPRLASQSSHLSRGRV
jgi:hypothetical protein